MFSLPKPGLSASNKVRSLQDPVVTVKVDKMISCKNKKRSGVGLGAIALVQLNLLSVVVLAQQRVPSFPDELDHYVANALRDFQIPGAAIVIVKDDRVVATKGYGVRKLGTADPVDADTIFDIASLTKSYTAAAIASLVDEKKLDWDTPVRNYLPKLEFSDPYLTANVTLRDLLSHRTGIRNNAAPFRGHLSRAQIVSLFKYLKPTAPFRTRWDYSNIGYALAGEVAAARSGNSWEEMVTNRIIKPLRMTRTTAYFDSVPEMGNYSWGHVMIDNVQRAVPRGSERLSTAAAGAIQTSAKDLATWLLFQLGDGSFDGKRLLSTAAMDEMHGPQIFVPTTPEFRKTRQLKHFAAYGFGWQVWDYSGHYMLWHSGNGDGQLAYMVLLPDENLGIAVLTNSWRTSVLLNLALAARISDYYLSFPTLDYVAEYRETWKQGEATDAAEENSLAAARIENTKTRLPLASYAGHYRDQLGLDINVTLDDDNLRFSYANGPAAALLHSHYDTFRVNWANPFMQGRPAFVSFDLDERGQVRGLKVEILRDKIEAVKSP